MTTQQQTVQNSQDKKSEIQSILEKLRQRDSELFARIVDAIDNQDTYASKVLANEVVEIRKATSIIEYASADILNQPNYPDLLLCPVCCSPEISISSNSSPRCYCLECGKFWNVEAFDIKSKGIEKVWSLA